MHKTLIAVVLGLAAATSANAAGDAAAGKTKSATCVACHGTNGKGIMPIYPNLCGQNEAYMVNALQAYKNKQRGGGQSAVMTPMAANLSDQDMADLAAYYSQQTCK